MKISVIIPSYKPQAYIWECLDSICSQTFPREEFEVILVLNGCCEPFNGQIKEYIANHSCVQWNYIQTDQGGVSNARNMALDVAKGEYMTFIDDDDYVSPSYLEELYEKADEGIMPLCYPLSFNDGSRETGHFNITGEYEKWSGKGPVAYSKPRRFFNGPVYKLIRRDIIGDRRYDVRFRNGEDSLFMFLISDRLHNVDFTSRNAVYYRRFRENSATTRSISINEQFKNSVAQIKALSKIYFSGGNYKLPFYCIMVRGAIYSLLAVVYDHARAVCEDIGLKRKSSK